MADEPNKSKEEEQTSQAPTRKKRKGRGRKRKAAAGGGRGRRPAQPFPPVSFQSVLLLAETIQKYGAGQPMRRLTIFEKLEKSPESSASRLLITNSGRYGLTEGSYISETISLSDLGRVATSPEEPPVAQFQARFKLAVDAIAPFKFLYDKNKGSRLPSPEVLRDSLSEASIDEGQRQECVDIFLENLNYLGLLKTVAGAQRILTLDHALEETAKQSGSEARSAQEVRVASPQGETGRKRTTAEWKKICFVIAPIGSEQDEQRKHSDMILEALITRALEKDGYQIIRADQITSPGLISQQVIEHLLNAGLVIADLSFHNPNVFYELAIRHLIGLPTVHLIRKGDGIPFDLKDFRTITIDTGDKYDLVAKLDTYRAAIANHVREAIQQVGENENPIRIFAKGLTISRM